MGEQRIVEVEQDYFDHPTILTEIFVTARPHRDGSAGDADYGRIGAGYTDYRRPDPRIAAAILDALGEARSVVNVGAGAGSYEPTDREVTAVEPSAAMRANRPTDRPAIDATADALPFPDDSFDAAMSTFSVHQWPDLVAGLRELRRVARGPVVIMSVDPDFDEPFWLNDYAPEVMATEDARFPTIARIADALGGQATVRTVPIPLDCTDGFNQAFYGRPEMLLQVGARTANSAWSFVAPEVQERFVRELGADLESGEWDRRYGFLRTQPTFDGGLRLVIGRP
jgi:SAM-dependent methyltransferase